MRSESRTTDVLVDVRHFNILSFDACPDLCGHDLFDELLDGEGVHESHCRTAKVGAIYVSYWQALCQVHLHSRFKSESFLVFYARK